MDIERKLYNSFVEKLADKLASDDISPKELDIIRQFLKDNNIQATMENKNLKALSQDYLDLPFDDDNVIPLRGNQ